MHDALADACTSKPSEPEEISKECVLLRSCQCYQSRKIEKKQILSEMIENKTRKLPDSGNKKTD